MTVLTHKMTMNAAHFKSDFATDLAMKKCDLWSGVVTLCKTHHCLLKQSKGVARCWALWAVSLPDHESP